MSRNKKITEVNITEANIVVGRRRFIKQIGACAAYSVLPMALLACERHRYIRPAGELDLGPVKDLLYDVSNRRRVSTLVFRDINGWSALSTRCTYRGCDLTYQQPVIGTPVLLCPCCRTRFRMNGAPFDGWPATHPLPWMKVTYRDGHLYADPGKQVSSKERFTTREIEEAIRELRKRIQDEQVSDGVKIPEVLLGKGDGEPGGMFLEDDPNLIHELDMIK